MSAASATPLSARLPQPFIAADVGGTHVRIGLVQAELDASLQVLAYSKFRCADYAGLADIVGEFLSSLGGLPVDTAVIASAGYPLADGTVITANLPWPLSPAKIREALGLRVVHLVNDFEAVAHAVGHLGASEVLRLTGPERVAPGPLLVLGPGTGLGAAVWIPSRDGAVVLATEAGQAALAVTTELEAAVLRQLRGQRTHVSIEHALSGPGLMNLYTALCALRAATPVHAHPGDITRAALDGSDPLALQTLDVFCGLLGSTVGDMALLYGVQGVYLAGGILPHLRQFLVNSDFVARFLDKGPMREALERVSVSLVEHGQLGVIGAASWYLGSEFLEK